MPSASSILGHCDDWLLLGGQRGRSEAVWSDNAESEMIHYQGTVVDGWLLLMQ